MTITATELNIRIAEIAQAVKAASADTVAGRNESATAITLVRALATDVASDERTNPAAIKAIKNKMHADMIGLGVPKGTADPYRKSLEGFIAAVKEGVALDKGFGRKGDQPMPASVAPEFLIDKSVRDERVKIAELRKSISAAVARAVDPKDNAGTITRLTDVLADLDALVPAADAIVTTEGTEDATAATALLADIFGEAQAA